MKADAASPFVSGKVRALVVDDELLARQVLREYLADQPEIEIVGECADGFAAVKAIQELQPDLVFLDVQMPRLNGFEVLELVDAARLAVVFVTAFDRYALEAFRVHAVAYLLKPYRAERLAEAGRLALGRIGAFPRWTFEELGRSARPQGEFLQRVLIRDGARVFVIPVDKIDYVKAQDDYVAIVAEGREHLKQQTISSLEAGLDPARFVRIHRSHLLQVERLARLEMYAKDSWLAILADGTKLPVSRKGYDRLKALL